MRARILLQAPLQECSALPCTLLPLHALALYHSPSPGRPSAFRSSCVVVARRQLRISLTVAWRLWLLHESSARASVVDNREKAMRNVNTVRYRYHICNATSTK